jgi:hypothetical protein
VCFVGKAFDCNVTARFHSSPNPVLAGPILTASVRVIPVTQSVTDVN